MPAISNPVKLPAKKGHDAGCADAMWAPDDPDGWTCYERGTGKHTKKYQSEEKAIQAARRREWVK